MAEINVITVKIPSEMKKKMKQVKLNWSEYIRGSIQRKLEEQQLKAASDKLDDIRKKSKSVSTSEIVAWIRENRER